MTRILIVLLAAIVASGCASSPGPRQPRSESVLASLTEQYTRVRLMDGRTGEPVAAGDLAERLDRADVVLFGELHGHPVGLPVAAAIWRDMLGHREEGRRPALLLEFFERDQQLAIDDYLAGMIEEDEFLGATGKRPDYDHREMLEFAKLRGHPVIAANAPRRYVRLARTDGFDRLRGLSPAQRSMFVLPPTDDGPKAYRDRFVEAMGGMDAGHGGSGPLDFLRAQLVWDATMADSVATALEHRHAPVALVVGRFHVEFDGATRSYLQARRRGADILSIVMVDAWSDELREEDRGRGDIVAYVGPVERASRPPAGSAESGSTDGDSGG